MVHENGIAETAVSRTPLHTRVITYRGFLRGDGLWDIEGHLLDKKDYPAESPDGGYVQVGTPVHGMSVRVTVNDELVIQGIEAGMPSTPFSDCALAVEPLHLLVGTTLGKGWRKMIEARIGGTRSCTHLRELLLNLATAAIQTITPYLSQFRKTGEPQAGEPNTAPAPKPFFIDQCVGWRSSGTAVMRLHPEYARPAAASPAGIGRGANMEHDE